MTPSVDPFDVVDFVRGICCSFSTISSICLFNSANLGSRSSRGLPSFQMRQVYKTSLIYLPQPNIFAFRAAGGSGTWLSSVDDDSFWERGNNCKRGRFSTLNKTNLIL
jgi:hypothetical protein